MIIKYIAGVFCILACLVAQGCADTDDNDNDNALAEALALAGSNRGQLEAVLNHYSNDSIGLEAAKFLIRNMPGHYSYADTVRVNRFYDSLDSLTRAMKGMPNKDIQSAIKDLCARHDAECFPTIEDVRIITSEFLIDNIDGALRQWRELPWCDRLSFDQFCEYILPYKTTELQELKPWRQSYDSILADSLSRISSCSLYRISSFQAAETVNNCLKQSFSRDRYDYDIPQLYYRLLTRLAIPFATCDELCNTTPQAFRAAGVSAAIDNVPVWGYGNRGHSWVVVNGPNGHDIPFVPIDGTPNLVHKPSETVGKAYRRTYARNRELVELNNAQPEVPEVFRNVFQRDVTPMYAETRDVELDVDAPDGEYELTYWDGDQWQPLEKKVATMTSITFDEIPSNTIYILHNRTKGSSVRIFRLDKDNCQEWW